MTEADCYGAVEVCFFIHSQEALSMSTVVCVCQVHSGKAVLFVPHLPEDYATWMGQ